MATLKEDIKTQAKWLVKAFSADKLKLDFSIESLIEIDIFYNLHSENGGAKRNGRLTKNLGLVLFSIGSYIGETIIKAVPGSKWKTDDNDPQGEINASIILPNGAEIWPMQKAMKRFKNGNEDAIYVYGHDLTREYTKHAFNDTFWTQLNQAVAIETKAWWKFW